MGPGRALGGNRRRKPENGTVIASHPNECLAN